MAKKAKTEAKTDAKPSKAATPPPAPVAPELAATNDVVETDSNVALFGDLLKKLSDVTTLLAAVKQEARTLEKRVTKELKAANKANAKRKSGRGNRAPSGFVKPTLITPELADFLGREHGSLLARTEVTREINKYIRENKLQDPTNGRKIIPDAKLAKLLNVSKKEELTYFNLQRYMKPHFATGGVLPNSEKA